MCVYTYWDTFWEVSHKFEIVLIKIFFMNDILSQNKGNIDIRMYF